MLKTCKICGKQREMMSWENTCFQCNEEKHYKELKEEILSGETASTSCEDKIVCPHCGEIQEYDADDYEVYEDGDHVMQCHDCEKYFRLTVSVSYYYDTEILND